MPEKVIFLYTSCPKVLVEVAQNRLEQVLLAKKLTFSKIDGAIADNKEERDKLFAISGHRGEYPQCFIQNDDGSSIKFVGLWEAIESLLECDSIPGVPAEATFKHVFSNVATTN